MESTQRRDARVVVLGDQLITPAGDPKGMGWLGRVIAKTPAREPRIDFYSLAAPDETSTMLSERWLAEVSRRFSADTDNYLVVALGHNDPAAGVSVSRSRLNLATILDESMKAGVKCFVIGPTPHADASRNHDIEHLASGYEDVASRRNVKFVDCFRPLVEHAGWNEEMSYSIHGLPGQVGHGLIAWLVLNRGWYEWLGLSVDN